MNTAVWTMRHIQYHLATNYRAHVELFRFTTSERPEVINDTWFNFMTKNFTLLVVDIKFVANNQTSLLIRSGEK